MRAEEFTNRVKEAERVIRYTFRLEIPEAEQDLKGHLIECSLNQAYKMAKPLFWDHWENHPFLNNLEFKWENNQQVGSKCGSETKLDSDHQAKQERKTKKFKEEGERILCDAAVAELYCMIRKIIGEENTMTAYAACEYAFFDPEAFTVKTCGTLSEFVTGMDDLFNRKIYTFENDQSLTINKEKLKVKGLGKKLGSRNQLLKKTVNNVDAKLATVLPGYQSFFSEEKAITDPKEKWKNILKISDLDLMIILKRSSKKLDILEVIQKSRQDHTTLSVLQIQRLQCLHKELTNLCEQRCDDKGKKYLTTVELKHLSAADKLYIQMEIERTMNCTMLVDLLKNIQEFSDKQTVVMFADPASIKLFSRCFDLGNIYNRTEVIDLTFQGLQNSSTLLRDPSAYTMHTWESDVQRKLKGTIVDTIDHQKMSFFEQWKKVYEEEMDCWSNWIFPLFMSCFCVVLSENIKKEQSDLKKNDAKEISIMYKELSDYINEEKLKMNTMTFDDESLSNAKKNLTLRNIISGCLMNALQEKRRLPIPVTLKEVNEIMPKRPVDKGIQDDNHYLNYSKIQFLRRNNGCTSSGDAN